MLTLVGISQGQSKFTVSGEVSDKSSGETLIGAALFVNGTGVAISNEYGFYSFDLPGGIFTIEIKYIGLETKLVEIDLKANTVLNISLESPTKTLSEVVISSVAKNEQIQSTEMGVKTLSSKVIKQLPAVLGEADVLRAIQLLPGVSTTSEASSGFNVRGGSADQNLILLDEATIFNATHLFGLFSVFNSDVIKEAKLYKGGVPATYGGRLSSVLDVRQREGNSKKFVREMGIGLISSRALIEGPIGRKKDEDARGSFIVAGRRSYVDLFTNLTQEFRNNQLFFYDLNLKTNYALNAKNRLYVSGYFGRDNFKLPGLVGAKWGNSSGTIRWTRSGGEKWFVQTSLIASQYDYNLDNLRSGYEFTWKSNIINYNLRPRATYYLNDKTTIRFGADALYYNFRPGQINPLKKSPIKAQEFQQNYASEVAFYLDNEQKVTSKLAIQYGLRASYFLRLGGERIREYSNDNPLTYNEIFNTYSQNTIISERQYARGEIISRNSGLEPRLSIRYKLSELESFKFGYNKMYQYVHLISNTTSPTPLDVWTPSGPYIDPQNADQYALGYFKNTKNGKFEISSEVYYKKLNNITDFIDGADLLFNENIESQIAKGNGRSYGIELQINKTEGKLTGWISYTLSKSEAKVTGINNNKWYSTNSDQRHQLNVIAFYKLNKRLELSANFIYGSGRPVTYPSGKYQSNGLIVADFSSRNSGRLPDYHRLDISATLNPKEEARVKGQWVFSIINVYNRLNAASIFFREITELNGVELATGTTEAVQIAYFPIIPSVTYNFKF
jgi:hypothetical protein